MSGGSSRPLGERRHRQRLVMAVRHAFHRRLMGAGVFGRAVPHPDHVLARTPRLVLRIAEADDRAALRADQILAGQPTVQPSRAACATIWSRVWTALGRRMRGIASISVTMLEELHAERDRAQLQQTLQIGDKFGPVLGHIGISRRVFS